MNHAIKLDGAGSVIVRFLEHKVQQLTPNGLRETDEVLCEIAEAEGLRTRGVGSSLRAVEDNFDRYEGFRIALKRAARMAFPDDKSAQDQLRQLLHYFMVAVPRCEADMKELLAADAASYVAVEQRTLAEERELEDLRWQQQNNERISPNLCGPGKGCEYCSQRLERIAELERKAAA